MGEKTAAAVVDDDDVQCLVGALRSVEVRCVGGDRLAGGGAGKQSQEDRQIGELRHDLLESDAGDVEPRDRGPEIGVSLIGAHDESAGLGHRKIHACDASLGREEPLAQVLACNGRKRLGIVAAGLAAHVLREQLANLTLSEVDCRQDDVAGRLLPKLHDAFTEVRVDDFDPVPLEVRVEAALLGQHRLALDDTLRPVSAEQHQHDRVVLGCIARPVHVNAVGFGIGLELLPQLRKSRERVPLDLGRFSSERFPIRDTGRGAVPPLPDEPQCLVVPRRAIDVGNERGGALGVAHTRDLSFSTSATCSMRSGSCCRSATPARWSRQEASVDVTISAPAFA